MIRRDEGAVIAGVGIVSAFGGTPELFWNALETGRGEARVVDPTAAREDPVSYLTEMCVSGINKAASEAEIDLEDGHGCIIVGTGMGLSDLYLQGRPSAPICTLRNILRTRLRAKVIVVATACCAGAQAVAYAADLLGGSAYRWVIAGGAEAFSEITECGFQRLKAIDRKHCRPFDKRREGIAAGDGAAFFALRRRCEGMAGGLAEIAGCGMTSDAHHPVAPAPDACQAKRAILLALERAGILPAQIDVVVAHGTGTLQNDRIEAGILTELFGAVDVTAPKGLIGHTGGASGAFGILTAVGMLMRQRIPPIAHLQEPDESFQIRPVYGQAKDKQITYVLVNTFAFGGSNTAIVCRRNRTG